MSLEVCFKVSKDMVFPVFYLFIDHGLLTCEACHF